MALLKIPSIADVLASIVFSLIKLLSTPSCEIIEQLKIDYDYIEVQPEGWFFHISEKKFVRNPELDGSPRAFVLYKYTGTVRKPKEFIEGN